MAYTPKNKEPKITDVKKVGRITDPEPELGPLSNEDNIEMVLHYVNASIDHLSMVDPTDFTRKAIAKLRGALQLLS